jgi:hypothetical protein
MDQVNLNQHRVMKNPLPTHKIQKGNKIVAVREDHAAVSVEHNIIDQYSPLGQATVLQNASSRIEFQIFSSRINCVKGVFLEIPITNNDGTNSIELISPYFFCTLIEILSNSNSMQEIYPEGQLMAHRMMTDEQNFVLSRFTNLLYDDTLTGRKSDPTATGTAAGTVSPILIAPGETRYIYIPLNNTVFEQTKVPFSSIKSTIRFRFTFDVFSNVTASTNLMTNASNLSVQSSQLYIFGSSLSKPGSDNIESLLLEHDYSANYYKQERQVLNNGQTLPTSRPKQSLTNLNGSYANIMIMLRDLSAAKESQYQWKFINTGGGGPSNSYNPTQFSISGVTLYDSNGTPWSLNNLGFFLAKWTAPNYTGADSEAANYSKFADKFSYVEYNLSSNSWNEVRRGFPGTILINNAWSIEYNVGGAGPYLAPYPLTPFPSGGKSTETCVVADRLYSITLTKDGQLSFYAH